MDQPLPRSGELWHNITPTFVTGVFQRYLLNVHIGPQIILVLAVAAGTVSFLGKNQQLYSKSIELFILDFTKLC